MRSQHPKLCTDPSTWILIGLREFYIGLSREAVYASNINYPLLACQQSIVCLFKPGSNHVFVSVSRDLFMSQILRGLTSFSFRFPQAQKLGGRQEQPLTNRVYSDRPSFLADELILLQIEQERVPCPRFSPVDHRSSK